VAGARHWTKREAQGLLLGAGAFGIAWLQSRTQAFYDWPHAPKTRSYRAVKDKAYRMGLGGFTRGAWGLVAVCRETGYVKSQLLRACAALNQKWKRTGPRGDFLITDDQVDELIEWLKHDFWCKSKHLYACGWCSGIKRPHYRAGLCGSCYWKYRGACLALGMPCGVQQQREFAVRLRGQDIKPEERKFLEKAIWRLSKGQALEQSRLEWLAILIPGAWHAS